MCGPCNIHRRDDKCYKIFVGKLEMKRPLKKVRQLWGNDTKSYLMGNVRGYGFDIGVAQGLLCVST
jgi:hypothetical protein